MRFQFHISESNELVNNYTMSVYLPLYRYVPHFRFMICITVKSVLRGHPLDKEKINIYSVEKVLYMNHSLKSL
jgi:hypothetical protein